MATKDAIIKIAVESRRRIAADENASNESDPSRVKVVKSRDVAGVDYRAAILRQYEPRLPRVDRDRDWYS